MHRQDIRNLTSLCVDYGVKYAVIAPGSRNAPLTIAFTSQNGVECLSLTDERSAAFFALGLSQLKSEPVALVCTSGSAVLNFAPAIVEAFYQNLPLIVITADRPMEWIDQSDGQTIRQQNIYNGYIKASFQLPSDQDSDDTMFSDRLVGQALDTALAFPMGPVHLNVPMKEPLYTNIPAEKSYSKSIISPKTRNSLENLNDYLSAWNNSHRKMIVVGQSRPDVKLKQLLNQLAEREDVIVVADNLSNIHGNLIVDSPDLFLAGLMESDLTAVVPDLLITIGQSVISKKLKDLLRKNKLKYHWQLNAGLPYADTYLHLTDIVNVNVCDFLSNFTALPINASASYLDVKSLKNTIRVKFENYLSDISFSDLKVVNSVFKHTPPDYVVQISNSTPIRISQLLENREDLNYFCNRGTSGIEGSVSTAAGSAYRSKKNTLFLTGDLSFLYDSNGLWHQNLSPKLKIVVLNNQGANIFNIIGDDSKIEHCKDFFNVPHSVNMNMLCAAYGVKHLKVTNEEELNLGLKLLFEENEKLMVLEVITSASVNTSTFKNLFKKIRI